VNIVGRMGGGARRGVGGGTLKPTQRHSLGRAKGGGGTREGEDTRVKRGYGCRLGGEGGEKEEN